MKKVIILAGLSLMLTVPVFAEENAPPPQGGGQNFEQHKAQILKRIDARIARNQEEKACVQSAQTREDLRACQEKFKAELKEQRFKRP